MQTKVNKTEIKWEATLTIEEMMIRKNRYGGTFIVCYFTGGGTFIASEELGKNLCLFEPYSCKGKVKFPKGGTYLQATEVILLYPEATIKPEKEWSSWAREELEEEVV